MKKAVLAILYLNAFALHAYCQNNSENDAASRLKKYLVNHPAEKVYLHFDKPYYAAGDTMYFKAYVTYADQYRLSDMSGVLHVNLISRSGTIEQSIKLKLSGGIAWGDFALPETLPGGTYRVRAYTQWMRNEGDRDFFEKEIEVGSVKSRVPENAIAGRKVKNKADIQFLPEGGSLVTGIRSKIAFKAVDATGKGIGVKGVVTDNDQKEIETFASARLGMGGFYLLPEEGKTYTAKLTYSDGTQATVTLPAAQSKGMVLAVSNERADTLFAGVFANKAYYEENAGKYISLVIYSGGVYTTINSTLNEPQLILRLPKKDLKTGVVRITLFSPQGEPVNERLAFVQNPDLLTLNIKSDQAAPRRRGPITLTLNALNKDGKPAEGSFSVAIIDESKVPINERDETTILSYMLLSSELKGKIEQPNCYFTNTTAQTRSDLDLVMLTHGYRRFAWKQLMNDNQTGLAYQPEKGLEISGVAKSLFGKTLNNATISLIPLAKGGEKYLLSSQTDNKGYFRFAELDFTDTGKFVLNAVNAKGKNNTQIKYIEGNPEPVVNADTKPNTTSADSALALYAKNSLLEQRELKNYRKGNTIMLKEVKIREMKPTDHYRSSNLGGAGHADQVILGKDISNSGLLSLALSGKLLGVVFHGGVPFLHGDPMLIVIDGVPIRTYGGNGTSVSASVDGVPPRIVETIEVLRTAGAAAIYGVRGGNGVLVITTKQGGGTTAADVASTGVLPVSLMGYYKAREFYAPLYNNNSKSAEKDLRTTIYWKPELITDKNGNAAFQYYNSDSRGSFRVVVEGIDNKGNIGRRVYRYKVE